MQNQKKKSMKNSGVNFHWSFLQCKLKKSSKIKKSICKKFDIIDNKTLKIVKLVVNFDLFC